MSQSKFKKYVTFAKVENEDQQIVGGYASTTDKDFDGDEITLDAIKNAWPEYIKYGNIREQHDPAKAVGVIDKFKFDDLGVYIKAHILDSDTWAKIKAGVLKGFSISGEVVERMGNKITEMTLVEISVVDRPNNPACVVDLIKTVDNEATKTNKEKQMSIHKDFADVQKAMEEAAALAPAADEKDEAKHEAYRMALKKVEEAMAGVSKEDEETAKEEAEVAKDDAEETPDDKGEAGDESEPDVDDEKDEDESEEEAVKEEARKSVKKEETKKAIKSTAAESETIKALQKRLDDMEVKMKMTKTVVKTPLATGAQILEKSGKLTPMEEIVKSLEETDKDTPLDKISKAHARADFLKYLGRA